MSERGPQKNPETLPSLEVLLKKAHEDIVKNTERLLSGEGQKYPPNYFSHFADKELALAVQCSENFITNMFMPAFEQNEVLLQELLRKAAVDPVPAEVKNTAPERWQESLAEEYTRQVDLLRQEFKRQTRMQVAAFFEGVGVSSVVANTIGQNLIEKFNQNEGK